MKLYGAAIAGIPNKTKPGVMKLTVNPLSVKDGLRTEFEIEHGAHDREVDFDNTRKAIEAFIDIVNLIDELVKQEKASLEANKLPYRPVSLWIGEDRRNPVDYELVAKTIFGPSFYTKNPSWSEISKKALATYSEISECTGFSPLAVRYAATGIEKELAKARTKIIQNRVAIQIAFMEASHDMARAKMLREVVLRWLEFAGRDKENFSRFQDAAKKLKSLMNEITLNWGSYGAQAVDDQSDFSYRTDEINAALIDYREPFLAGDPDTKTRIGELAYEMGEIYGHIVSENNNIFCVAVVSEKNKKDPKYQEENPVHFFYDWHPHFRSEFYRGYNETYDHKVYRHVKLPTDPRQPFFADPTADSVCAQFEIALQVRNPEDIYHEQKYWRDILGIVANRAADYQP